MVRIELSLVNAGKICKVEECVKTVDELKSYIESYHGIPHRDQILMQNFLFLDYHGKDLANVPHPRIKVYTKIPPQKFKVTIRHRLCTFLELENVSSNDMVCGLKMMIDEKYGLSPHRQLLYAGDTLMYDQDSLDEYIVEKAPTFLLKDVPVDEAQRLDIHVNKNGQRLCEVRLEISDTVYTLRGEVRRQGKAAGNNFRFLSNQQPLLGLNTFAFYGIPSGYTVDLVEE